MAEELNFPDCQEKNSPTEDKQTSNLIFGEHSDNIGVSGGQILIWKKT